MIKIGIDVDGVLADAMSAFLPRIKSDYGLDVMIEDIVQYDFEKCTPVSKTMMDCIYSDPDFFYSLKPLPDAVAATQYLRMAGFEIFIITSRIPEMVGVTTDWLEAHRFEFDSVVISNDKAHYASFVGLNYFIEDRYKTAMQLSEHCRVFLIDYPWNQRPLPNVVRVKGWNDIITQLRKSLS